MIEFQAWPKVARLNRAITITEKIDGTNAAVGIQEFQFGFHVGGTDAFGVSHDQPDNATLVFGPDGEDGLPDLEYLVYAQSRKRIITPTMDNAGFAHWVWDHAEELAKLLGPGLHFGEWWGSGIQRGYGLEKGEKRFSLFNTKRWAPKHIHDDDGTVEGCPGCFADPVNVVPGLDVVPVLYQGPFTVASFEPAPWEIALGDLIGFGSRAAPGFMHPEGVVIYHHAADLMFKVTLENDAEPKSVTQRREMALAA